MICNPIKADTEDDYPFEQGMQALEAYQLLGRTKEMIDTKVMCCRKHYMRWTAGLDQALGFYI